jgi:sugar O-acyltransferase (sialic acid O-acetyltransferase NeuD family)
MPQPKKLVIIGAGGLAREVAAQLESPLSRGEVDLLGFAEAVGGRHLGRSVDGYSCQELEHYIRATPDLTAIVAIGESSARARVGAELDGLGIPLETCVDESLFLSRTVRIGEGSILLSGSVLTANISLGRCVVLNPGCTVGHDTVIEDFVTISPGAHIAGNVHIRRGAFIGIGASICNGTEDRKLVIGARAIVGAGACVISDVASGATVKGVPAS